MVGWVGCACVRADMIAGANSAAAARIHALNLFFLVSAIAKLLLGAVPMIVHRSRTISSGVITVNLTKHELSLNYDCPPQRTSDQRMNDLETTRRPHGQTDVQWPGATRLADDAKTVIHRA